MNHPGDIQNPQTVANPDHFSLNHSELKFAFTHSTDYSYSYFIEESGELRLEWVFGSFEQITGFKPMESMTFENLARLIYPPDIPKVAERRRLLEQGEKVCTELRIVTANGDVKWIQDKGIPVWDGTRNRVERIIGSAIDITERKVFEEKLKDSEEKFRNIAENMPGMVMRYYAKPGSEEKFLYISKGVEHLFEVSHEVALENVSLLWDRIYPDDVEKLQSILWRNDGNPANTELEYRILLPDGRIKWVQFTATGNPAGDDGIIWDSISIDITKKKQVEAELLQYRKELEDLNATKDRFFNIIAHDLKGPISAVMQLNEIIVEDFDEYKPEEVQAMLSLMLKEVRSNWQLLNDLLEWSRSHSGFIEFQPDHYPVCSLIESSLSALYNQLEAKDLTLNLELNPAFTVYTDRRSTETVLRNIISNSIKFTNRDGNIHIAAEQQQTDQGSFINIFIEDDGIGIPEKEIPKLFSIEVNQSRKGTEQEEGTGLGLIICKEFIEKNNGKITVKSTVSQGTTFIISLPAGS